MSEVKQHHEFSPSKLGRLVACPGSYQMSRWLPSIGGTAADEGTMLHYAVATGDRSKLNYEQEELINSCVEFMIENGLTRGTNSPCEWIPEAPLSLKEEDGSVITEGTADLVVCNKDGLCIVDWKFGMNQVTDASRNLQLATYAASAMQIFQKDSCKTYIYQPRIGFVSEYEFCDKEVIIRNIKKIIARAKRTDVLELNVSAECRYCPASIFCPRLRTCANEIIETQEADIAPEILSDLYDQASMVRKAVDNLEEAVKAKCRDLGSCGNWKMRDRAGAMECTDIAGLFDSVKDVLTAEEIVSTMKVTRSKLQDMYAAKLVKSSRLAGDKMSKTEAQKAFEEATKDVFEKKPNIKVLTRG